MISSCKANDKILFNVKIVVVKCNVIIYFGLYTFLVYSSRHKQ